MGRKLELELPIDEGLAGKEVGVAMVIVGILFLAFFLCLIVSVDVILNRVGWG